MADTRVQLEVEDWVRKNWLPQQFGATFRRERLQLTSGGVFDFDAVSPDNSTVATISTSAGVTSGGKHPTGKLMKIRSDILFLLLADATRRIIVLTDPQMYQLCMREKDGGRVPSAVEFALAQIPEQLEGKLRKAQSAASREVRPRQ